MLSNARIGFLLPLILLLATAASTQQPGTPTRPPDSKIHLDVVVTPKSGAAETGLQQQDFTLLDNGVQRPITSFRAVTGRETPLEVVLIVDTANTGYQNVNIVHTELDRFLRAEGGHLAQSVAIGVLSDRGMQMLGDFSSDGNVLSSELDQNNEGIRIFRTTGGGAGAERWKLSLAGFRQIVGAEVRRPGHKVMIWVSPGWPLAGGVGRQFDSKQEQQIFADLVNLTNRLMQSRVTLYVVDPLGAAESVIRANNYKPYLKAVTKSNQVTVPNLALQVLAIQSGGLVFTSNNDIAKLVQDCIADATPYYEISFEPPPSDHLDEYHHLEIKLADPSLTARARQGYYAQSARTN